MGNSLDAPRTEKDSDSYTSSMGLECGASGMQGWRIEMEDTHITKDIPSKPDHLFLGVWDGHAGGGAAVYAMNNIIPTLEATDEWKEYLSTGATNVELIGKAMIKAFLKVDSDMKIHQDGTYGQDTSGCTSVTAIVTPKYIICANAGDSRCVMGTNKTAKPLSDDHKPYNSSERNRIESAGGFVQWNRVDGDLAVSRALGDFSYKNRPDLPAPQQKISPEPDIEIHERTDGDDVLLLACDGLWDVLSTEEAVNEVRRIYASGEKDAVKIAEEMLDISLERGSKDNISCVVVKLPGAEIGPESNGGVAAMRAKREAEAKKNPNRSMPGEDGGVVYFTPSPIVRDEVDAELEPSVD